MTTTENVVSATGQHGSEAAAQDTSVHKRTLVEFPAGELGVKLLGNVVAEVVVDSRAAEVGVQVGWTAIDVNGKAMDCSGEVTNVVNIMINSKISL